MRHMRLVPQPSDTIEEGGDHSVHLDIAERMHAARQAGSIEAALAIWGVRVHAARGSDVAWRTTRPPWPNTGRLYNWRSPVWLPTAEEERNKRVEPLRLSSLFDRAA